MRLFLFLFLILSSIEARASIVQHEPFSRAERKASLRSHYTIQTAVHRTEALQNRLNGAINEACTRAHLSRVDFDGIDKIPSQVNFCEVAVSSLPLDVLALIEKVAELHTKVAEVLGQKSADIYTMEIGITVRSSSEGSRNSKAIGGGVVLTAFPDWTYRDFPSKIYAHEIIHTLVFNEGVIADALVGVQDHPLLHEALPDVVSATVHASQKMELGEADLPECLKNYRDSAGTRGFDESFRHFYPLAGMEGITRCCATLDLDRESPKAKTICSLMEWRRPSLIASTEAAILENQLTLTPHDEAHLAAPFEAENCRVQTKTGLVYLDNCDSHQFSDPLVAFFFRLQERTGKSQVAAFIQKIQEGSENPAIYECGYTRGVPTLGGVKAFVALRPLLRAFMALRDSFSAADRQAFDRAWKDLHFEKMVDLDRIYRSETLEGVAQLAVKAKNTIYQNLHECGDPYRFDPVACAVSCKRKH